MLPTDSTQSFRDNFLGGNNWYLFLLSAPLTVRLRIALDRSIRLQEISSSTSRLPALQVEKLHRGEIRRKSTCSAIAARPGLSLLAQTPCQQCIRWHLASIETSRPLGGARTEVRYPRIGTCLKEMRARRSGTSTGLHSYARGLILQLKAITSLGGSAFALSSATCGVEGFGLEGSSLGETRGFGVGSSAASADSPPTDRCSRGSPWH